MEGGENVTERGVKMEYRGLKKDLTNIPFSTS